MKLWLTAICITSLLVAGCDSEEPTSTSQDTASTTDASSDTAVPPNDTTPEDTNTAHDTSGSDTQTPHDTGSAQDTSGSDTQSGTDTQSQDTNPEDVSVCGAATAEIEAARAEAAAGCERGSQCASRYNSLCPDGGCFTHFYAGSDLSRLDAALDAYTDGSCGEGAVCSCAPPPEALACVDGSCTTCPSSCDYTCALDCTCYQDACGCDQPFCADGGTTSCETLRTRMQQARDDIATCTDDADCTVSASPLCPELGCYLVFNTRAAKGELNALVSAYTESNCPSAVCACTPPPESAVCVNGTCEAAASTP